MNTATIRMLPLKISCPKPARAWVMASANSASKPAPARPARMPPLMNQLLRRIPWVAARTIPTIRPASSTSRKTINRLASIVLALFSFHDNRAFGLVWMVIVEKRVSSRVYGDCEHRNGVAGNHDFFELHVVAFELIHGVVMAGELNAKSFACRNSERGGREAVIFNHQLDRFVVGYRHRSGKNRRAEQQGRGDSELYENRHTAPPECKSFAEIVGL